MERLEERHVGDREPLMVMQEDEIGDVGSVAEAGQNVRGDAHKVAV